MFNEIDKNYDDVAISTFNVGFPAEHDLRKSLTGKPVASVRQLMDRIDKYRKIEEDQLQGKGKAKVITQEMRDFMSDRFHNNQSQKDLLGSQDLPTLRQLMLCSENQYNRFWRRLKTSCSSNGRTRW